MHIHPITGLVAATHTPFHTDGILNLSVVEEQIARLASTGYMGAAKAVMGFLGVPVGPARLPHTNPNAEQLKALRTDLETMGFFDWVKPRPTPNPLQS